MLGGNMKFSREEIDKYLKNNYRRMKDPEFMFGVDNNQDSYDDFKDADLRILLVFNTPGKIRGFSSTVFTLDKLIHSGDKGNGKVFSDYVYLPYDRTAEILIEDEIPWLFGNVSHSSYKEYDLIFVSLSIFPEVVNYPPYLKYSDIPLGFEGRLERDDVPPIVVGGSAATASSCLFGETGEGRSMVDMAFFGYGDGVVDNLVEDSLKFGKDIKQNKEEYYEYIKTKSSVKDFAYFPADYYFNFDKEEMKITSIDKKDERLPDKVKVNNMNKEFVDFNNFMFSLDGSGTTRHNLVVAQGCTGDGQCSFCLEGNLGGRYHEKGIEELVEDMEEMKRTSAISDLGYFSYNLNYYSKFIDLMKESAERFKNLNLLAMRADVMANSEEFIRLGKRLGLTKVGMAVEGMGSRIRNQLLNKNLSKEQIRQAARNIFKQKFSSLKINLIITGEETEEDIDEWLEELDMILEEKEKIGVGAGVRITHTSLTIYNTTPMRWMPRNSAELSWKQERTMGRYMQALRDRGVRFKFYGRGLTYFFDQLMLDLGPVATEILVKLSLEDGMRHYTDYRNLRKPDMKKYLEEKGFNYKNLFKEKDVDDILPPDIMEFTTDKKFEEWKDMHKRKDFRKDICLKTLANENPSCSACGFCEDKEEVLEVVDRSLDSKYEMKDVYEALSTQTSRDAHRIVLKQSDDWRMYDRRGLSRYIASLFLRESDYLFDKFYTVGRNSLRWASIRGQNGWAGGKWAFDIKWNDRVKKSELDKHIESVNNKLSAAKIIKIHSGADELNINNKQRLLWYGELKGGYTKSELKNNLLGFNWEVKKAKQMIGVEMDTEKVFIPDLKDRILFVEKDNKLLVFMELEMELNPYLILSSLFSVPYKHILRDSNFNVLDHIKMMDMSCDCGKKLGYSLFDNKVKSECSTCRGRKLLYYLKQN
jgi:hypothetical protein